MSINEINKILGLSLFNTVVECYTFEILGNIGYIINGICESKLLLYNIPFIIQKDITLIMNEHLDMKMRPFRSLNTDTRYNIRHTIDDNIFWIYL